MCLVCFFLGHLCWKRKLVVFQFVFIVSKENSLRPLYIWVTSNFVFSKGIGVLLSVYRENVLSYLNTTFTFKLIKVNFFSSGKSITLILYRISIYENCSALRLKWFTLRSLQISDTTRSRSHSYYIVYSLKLAKGLYYCLIYYCLIRVLDKDIFPALFE